MSLIDKKITSFSKPVSALADRPKLTATELKEWFDSNSTVEVKNSINDLIDILVSTEGALEVGAIVPGMADHNVLGLLIALKTLVDDRYTIEQSDTRFLTKFDKATAQDLVKTVNIDVNTGIFTVVKYDGSTQTWDTAIEKVALDVKLEGTDFVLTLADGTQQRVSLKEFIDTYTFTTSNTIQIVETIGGESKNYTFNLRDGSVSTEKMDPELLTTITGYVESASASAARSSKSEQSALLSKNSAQTSASAALASEINAKESEVNAKDSQTQSKISETNSSALAARAEAAAKRAEEIAGKEVIVKSDVINDLTTGGIYKVLSAEQGKLLQNAKVEKVPGKQLSTNDYTSEEKIKLSSLENYDDSDVLDLINGKAPLVHTHPMDDITGLSLDWSSIENKPVEFPPATHSHDERYVPCTEEQTIGQFDKTAILPIDTTTRLNFNGVFYSSKVMCAWYNDIAEARESDQHYPGGTVLTSINGIMTRSNKRLLPLCRVVSDTYGIYIGEADDDVIRNPIALCGLVLVRLDKSINIDDIGKPICSGENGTASIMTHTEVQLYPDRIIGVIHSFPNNDVWGNDKISTKDRIWIEVK